MLGDWTAGLNIKLSPYLDSAAKIYKFDTAISFNVKWTPIPEIKLDTNYSGRNKTLSIY
jgi:hypothetical protein